MKARRWKGLAALLAAGIPLVTTVSCDPYTGGLSLFRFDDHYDHGYWDVFVEDSYLYYDDCYFGPCYDDYYYDDYFIVDY